MYPTETQAVALLEKYAPNKKVLKKVYAHCSAVREISIEIAKYIPDTDIHILSIGSILHDIGRFVCPFGPDTIKHGIEGAKILRKEGINEVYARICERHLGAGITKEEIIEKNLPLPKQDFLPETREEKILAYADNLIKGDKLMNFNYVIERFRKELGEKAVSRCLALRRELEKLTSRPESLL